jgi:peptidoglycan/LPS O-acetylase OafA/YrhL
LAFQRRRRIKPVVDGPRGSISFTPFLGMILIVSSLFLYGASGVIAPWWGVVVMLAIWLVLFALCCASWSTHPKRLVWIGALAYPLWFCLIVAGALAFNWNA